jgi:hypothetical protein
MVFVKTINCWAEMQPYGIIPLTTEPDGLQYRTVCDVTARGKQLIEKALGVVEIQLEMNWDYGTNDEPHIGSIMVCPTMLPIFGVYALFDDGCHEVWLTKKHGLVGIQQGDSQDVIANINLWYGNDLDCRFFHPGTNCNWNPSTIS